MAFKELTSRDAAGAELAAKISANELADLGNGEVGYIRKMRSEDVSKKFPQAPDLEPGLDLWGLFGADGTPILLSDSRSSAFFKAAENDLSTVSVH
ncbi:DUF1150 family protein [Georhizobium profundi]|jgi:hypothetical protein|uniref:DUF1150 family protein n=1 Tax=Georhizobium profundi TaxID=2341112 RepID=A0A3S9AYV6_9HYPH|nr:DUF1150 family protein [Georhizobium profundi]AZN69889.1 DUF1150 family protein [Georhizobium profundi]GLQ40018.1 hypothetical protein GCM10007908_36380 [Rhizobium albus]